MKGTDKGALSIRTQIIPDLLREGVEGLQRILQVPAVCARTLILVERGRELLVVLAYVSKLVAIGKQLCNPITPSRKALDDQIQLVELIVLRERPGDDYALRYVLVRNDREVRIARQRRRA